MPSRFRLDPIQLLDHVAAASPQSAEFTARTPAQARAWQKRTPSRLRR
ncbi:MAG: hypothetical protein WBD40_02940 [Tepidisphaeraceae bacterium]